MGCLGLVQLILGYAVSCERFPYPINDGNDPVVAVNVVGITIPSPAVVIAALRGGIPQAYFEAYFGD